MKHPKLVLPATDPRVLVVGRFAVEGSTLRFDWPATTVKIAVRRAAQIWLRMDGNKHYFSVQCNDGQPQVMPALYQRVKDYLLPLSIDTSGKDDDVTVISIVKRTDVAPMHGVLAAAGGPVTLHGIVLDEGSELVPLPASAAPPKRLIEFYGDSDSCGFGIEGARSRTNSIRALLHGSACAHEQDATLAFPELVARALGAQAHNLSWSGIGAVWNAPFGGKEAMNSKWMRLVASDPSAGTVLDDAAGDTAATAASLPEAIAIYLGGNDFYTMGDSPHVGWASKSRTEEKFIEGFAAMLSAIRASRPAPTPILVLECDAMSASCLDSRASQAKYSEIMSRVLRAAVGRTADPDVHVLPLSSSPPVDFDDDSDFGVLGHWSVSGHRKVAASLAKTMGETLGWAVNSRAF
jgi:hypothetical protein